MSAPDEVVANFVSVTGADTKTAEGLIEVTQECEPCRSRGDTIAAARALS